ncbi:Pre-mRNA-splicing factor ATP-dependent RNA helicase DEAH1 [Turnera subulata]|uniref:RNA helicase n=1 Tax=Turnera subulata TaxID=218843 RepID=A0A9Q0G1I7_9ROSI|nr:Pre-mRNA-splicing factor ATP-dependent RNA helicase DEAH1 [Turnera subulata]
MFLPRQEEIKTAEEILKQRTRGFSTKIAELIVCPIYTNLPTELRAKILGPTPQGARKVILATNIAETSMTIDEINYVIYLGFCKMKSYNPRTQIDSLQVAPISKTSANQRAGQSGRTGPGKCFRLYTASNYQHLEDNNVPEIQRTNLFDVALTLKIMGIDDLIKFEFMDQPRPEALLQALELLYALNALDKNGLLTEVGKRMAKWKADLFLLSQSHHLFSSLLHTSPPSVTRQAPSLLPRTTEGEASGARRDLGRVRLCDSGSQPFPLAPVERLSLPSLPLPPSLLPSPTHIPAVRHLIGTVAATSDDGRRGFRAVLLLFVVLVAAVVVADGGGLNLCVFPMLLR